MWIAKLFERWRRAPVEPEPEVKRPAPPKPAAKRAGRPIASSLARTMEELKGNPEVSAAELSELLGVSKGYARTLLRRARERPAPAPVVRTAVANRRTAALALAEQGHPSEYIAEKLQTTPGEIEFILKVQRLVCA